MMKFSIFVIAALIALAMNSIVVVAVNSRLVGVTASDAAYVIAFERPAPQGELTLHGLWPEGQMSCTGDKFNPAVLAPIRDEMNTFWYSYKSHSDKANEVFWEHEWSKHGTCYVKANQGSSQFEYFSKTLALRHEVGLVQCDQKQYCDCRCKLDVKFKVISCTQKGSTPPV